MPKHAPLLFVFVLLLASAVSAQLPHPTPAGDPADALRPDGLPGRGDPPRIDPTAAATRERDRATLRAAITARARAYQDSAGGALTGMQSLLAAGAGATQPSSAYLTYSEDAEAICSLAPWECARYAWDAVTGAYIDNRGLSSAPFGAAPLTNVPTASLPAVTSAAPSAEAYQAIALFAAEQLAMRLEPLYAGSFSGDVSRLLGYLPPAVQAHLAQMAASGEVVHWGLWQGGAGGVFFADCAAPQTCQAANAFMPTSADNEAGAYTLFVPDAMPPTPETALTLLTRVYPALLGMGFTQVSDISTGYAFTSRHITVLPDGAGGQFTASRRAYLTGVLPIGGRTLTYAIAAGAAFPLSVTGQHTGG